MNLSEMSREQLVEAVEMIISKADRMMADGKKVLEALDRSTKVLEGMIPIKEERDRYKTALEKIAASRGSVEFSRAGDIAEEALNAGGGK